MPDKEATARIKINKLLEAAGWRFFADGSAPANIRLEPSVTIKSTDLDALGVNFEQSTKGFVDFLLLDAKGFPLLVLEAKSEDKNPLVGKEQARKYAKSQNCRFVILSNGNLHYFWDLEQGNPHVITRFRRRTRSRATTKVQPNPQRLIEEQVGKDYIALTQRPNYASEAAGKRSERDGYIQANKLRFLRPYQKARPQRSGRGRRWHRPLPVRDGHRHRQDADRRRRHQAVSCAPATCPPRAVPGRSPGTRRPGQQGLRRQLKNDYSTVIYKERRDDWRKAEIVVTTVQSLLFNDKYRRLFSPTDFDLVISDEAHRSIGGNARAVFEYFVGYKLGLTATPRDYLKKFDAGSGKGASTRDPREAERRLLLDTYRTFGCESASRPSAIRCSTA
jgi:type I restriction enzyme R subunit